MKRLPRGTKAQIMGTRLFQTMYTADQMQKAVADEREACAKVCEQQEEYGPLCETPEQCAASIRARGNT